MGQIGQCLRPLVLEMHHDQTVERVWEYLHDRWLSHRLLGAGYAAVVDAACAARNALIAEPGRLRSLTSFHWLPASVTTS